MTVIALLKELSANPYRTLLCRWNWKSALLSAVFRGLIFFLVNLRAGWDAAAAALLTEFLYRSATAGFYGAFTQALRRVEPAWKSALAGLLLLPAFQHALEFGIHYLRGTPRVAAAVGVSACFTGLSTLFQLYVMRRGAMLVGSGSASLAEDMRRMPALVAGFVLAGPVRLCRMCSLVWRTSS